MHRPFIVALLVLIGLATTIHAQNGGGAAAPKSGWTAPRTPWGDPDLQGNYTNKYETSTPFERPKEFEGRRMEDITQHELAAAMAKRQEETLARAKYFGGDPEGRIGNSAEFRDIYEITKGSRPWFVIDPQDPQDRGVQVMNVHGVLFGAQAQGIC